MNVFIVRNGEAITPPVTDNILEGITRRTVLEFLTEEIGMPVVQRPIDRSEVYLSDELIMTGTAAQITAVTHVDHRPIGAGVMGPVATRLRQIFTDVVCGKVPKYRRWNVPIFAAEREKVR